MKTIRWYAGLALGLSLCGCGAAGELDSIEAEDTVGSVQEALLNPRLKRVQARRISPAAGVGPVKVECPSDHPFLLGTAAQVEDGTLKAIVPGEETPTDLQIEGEVDDQEKELIADAVCSDAEAIRIDAESSAGQKTTQCRSGEVAVGGGAKCYGDGRLFRARPYPDVGGSEPIGWSGGCTSGRVETFAVCVRERDTFDFTKVRTARKDGTGSVAVACPPQSTALSAGGYCSNNKPLRSLNLNMDFSGATIKCADSSANVHGYVVCRPWQLTPPVR